MGLWLRSQFSKRNLRNSDDEIVATLRHFNWIHNLRQKHETTLFRQSGFCLFAVHVLFLFVRGGIIWSQCFHLVVHFFDGCGCWASQIQEFLKLIAWLDSLANITNQHHTYTDFPKVFYGGFFFPVLTSLLLPRSKPKICRWCLTFADRSVWWVKQITWEHDYKQVT